MQNPHKLAEVGWVVSGTEASFSFGFPFSLCYNKETVVHDLFKAIPLFINFKHSIYSVMPLDFDYVLITFCKCGRGICTTSAFLIFLLFVVL